MVQFIFNLIIRIFLYHLLQLFFSTRSWQEFHTLYVLGAIKSVKLL
jgi:hypothetical protein